MIGGISLRGIWTLYVHEISRGLRTASQTFVAPVLTTALYFAVFGGAIGSRMQEVGGVSYAAFIVPGLIMMSVLSQSIANASFSIYFPKFNGTVYEILSAPLGYGEILIAFIGGAATKSMIIGLIILATSTFFVDLHIAHPAAMLAFLLLTAVTFSLIGFIIGLWAKNFEELGFVPMLVVTPLTFLGGAFYSVDMLPQPWRTLTLFNPVVYLVSGFRWSFFDKGDVPVMLSLGVTGLFLVVAVAIVGWMFRTGYRLKP
jgi:ABC-2 type transport system permease protein